MRRRASIALVVILALGAPFALVRGAHGQADLREIVLDDALLLPSVARGRREPFPIDAVAARLVRGSLAPPAAGDAIALADGTSVTWEGVGAGDDGVIRHDGLRGGYVAWEVVTEGARTMILEASGHDHVTVNGEVRAGDPYGTGALRLPVALGPGPNRLLFRCSRGHVRAALREPPAPVFLNLADTTLPDFIAGEDWAVHGEVIVVNATTEPLTELVLRAGGSILPMRETRLPRIEALTARKVPFLLGGAVDPESRTCPVEITLLDGASAPAAAGGAVGQAAAAAVGLAATTITLRVRRPSEPHVRTFVSAIDGSVQYYAVVPPGPADEVETQSPPALILALHGASIEATGHAAVYAPKSWAYVVAPTNRRPYGFDWEEWGRLDAIEVLEIAQRRFGTDPDRTYLTGHSMGGHGTWHLGVTYPDRFAALGPSAGWVSFRSYGGMASEGATPIDLMLERAASPSDTLRLARNALASSVYVLHGEADDNVPVEHARTMRDQLEEIHLDFAYHEEPGAGHWWGNQCCDWPPMMDFFAIRARPYADEVEHVEFSTASPGVSSRFFWLSIEQQVTPFAPSTVTGDVIREESRITLRAENVARLSIDVAALAIEPPGNDRRTLEPGAVRGVLTVSIDGREIACDLAEDRATPLAFVRIADGTWSPAPPLAPGEKGPQRYGPFKDAFRNRVALVYGTRGSAEENAWALAKARFDAETFAYRGNGSIDVMPDVSLDPALDRDRSVILYGNADTNALWPALIGGAIEPSASASVIPASAPIDVTRGLILVGERIFEGDDLACLVVRPRPGSTHALVAAVSGTGPAGFRATERLPYFVSGVAYPDLIIFDATAAERGTAAVRYAGFFGPDWSLESGDFAEAAAPEAAPAREPAPAPEPAAAPEPAPVPDPTTDQEPDAAPEEAAPLIGED